MPVNLPGDPRTEPELRLRPVGERAVLVELDPRAEPQLLVQAARRRWPDALSEAVGADRTVMLQWRGQRPSRQEVTDALSAAATPQPAGAPAGPTLRIQVLYDGADLDAVAERVGCAVAEIGARHSARPLRVRFLGTAGFPYLTGADPAFDLLRRATPRVSVPAGSVAVAAGYTGIYPRPGPGGWWLIGHAERLLWDPLQHPPALLAAGCDVIIEPVG